MENTYCSLLLFVFCLFFLGYSIVYVVLVIVVYGPLICVAILCMPLLVVAMGFVVLHVALAVPARPDFPVHSANLTCHEKQQWGPDISFVELVEKSSMNTTFLLSYLSGDVAEHCQKLFDEDASKVPYTLVLLVILGLLGRFYLQHAPLAHPLAHPLIPHVVIVGFTLVSKNCGLDTVLLWMTDVLMLFGTYLGAVVAFPLLEQLKLAHMDWWIATCIPFRGRIIPVTVPMACVYGCSTLNDLKDLREAATEKRFKSLGESWDPRKRLQKVNNDPGLQSVKMLVPWGWMDVLAECGDAVTDVMAAWDLLKVESLMIGRTYSATAVISTASAMCCVLLQMLGMPIDDGMRQCLVGVGFFEAIIQFAITAFCVLANGHQPIDEFVFYSLVGNAISCVKIFIQWCSLRTRSSPASNLKKTSEADERGLFTSVSSA